MPYILAFWRQVDGESRDPGEVYDAICDGKPVDGLVTLPIADITQAFRDAFDAVLSRNGVHTWEGGEDSFLLETGAQHVFVVAGFKADVDHLDNVIDLMKRFACILYDPQGDYRYDPSDK
jgi:hypothetical protein